MTRLLLTSTNKHWVRARNNSAALQAARASFLLGMAPDPRWVIVSQQDAGTHTSTRTQGWVTASLCLTKIPTGDVPKNRKCQPMSLVSMGYSWQGWSKCPGSLPFHASELVHPALTVPSSNYPCSVWLSCSAIMGISPGNSCVPSFAFYRWPLQGDVTESLQQKKDKPRKPDISPILILLPI